MVNIDKSKPVMITGATGYVAGWIVKKLLDEGITVHATVRNPDDKKKLKYLDILADKSDGKILYFKADLLNPGSFDHAITGCELIFHTASPFTSGAKNPQKELINPALDGTRNVLESVNKSSSAKRVVLTSSVAAIFGDTKDLLELPSGTATEEHWNYSSSIQHQPYSYSKTLAEKKAWEIVKKQNKWDLVVVNPSLVIGPSLSITNTSDSFKIIKQLGDGSMKMGVPDFNIGLVDVRDLAIAHYNAGFMPEAEGRHIISAESKTFLQLAEMLREKYGNKYPFPKKNLPNWFVVLIAPFIGQKRKMMARNLSHLWNLNNSKSVNKLKMKYRPIEDSIVDFFQQMIENEVFEK